jgi:foldase protein PrsA
MRAWRAVLPLAAIALLLAACGGGGSSSTGTNPSSTTDREVVDGNQEQLPADTIAVVGGTPILRADFDRFFRQAEAAYEAQGRDFPATGTPEYEALKQQAVDLLVQRVQFAMEAELLGVTVSDADVAARLQELKDQFYQGDEAKYAEELEKFGITEADIEADLRAGLLNQELFDEVTKGASVTEEEVDAYYAENEDRFSHPDTREVAHILVETKKEADDIVAQLADGADFAELAKEKSTDTVSAADGGKLSACRGELCSTPLVKEFEEVAFALETGDVSEPVKTQFGWHVITALADIVPAGTTPLAEVRDSIREQLLQEERNQVMSDWVVEARAKYDGQVRYQIGFAPAASATAGADTTP